MAAGEPFPSFSSTIGLGVKQLDARTVGVMGDGRTYDRACALRAVTSADGMAADYYPLDHAFLGQVANRIINDVRGINRRDDRVRVSWGVISAKLNS